MTDRWKLVCKQKLNISFYEKGGTFGIEIIAPSESPIAVDYFCRDVFYSTPSLGYQPFEAPSLGQSGVYCVRKPGLGVILASISKTGWEWTISGLDGLS